MDETLTHLDLFSGIGGFSLAAGWAGFRTIAFCEIDPFCQEVLRARFGAVADTEVDRLQGLRASRERIASSRCPEEEPQGLRSRPVLVSDIRQFDGSRFRGATLLTGGFPCQPFSHAGKRRGKADDRHLWPEMRRVVAESHPHWVLAENVSGIIGMELDQVLADLEMEGYATRTFHIGAVGVNAPHRRMRVWIVGHLGDAESMRELQPEGSKREQRGWTGDPDSDAPDAVFTRTGEQTADIYAGEEPTPIGEIGLRDGPNTDAWDIPWIEVATSLCRVDDGLPAWVHARRVPRLKALGNAIVPQVAYQIIKAIALIERQHAR